MSDQVFQGRAVRNPYVNMHEEAYSDYPEFNETAVPATFEIHNPPMGRPVSQRQQAQYHHQPMQPMMPQQHQIIVRQMPPPQVPPPTLNFANNRHVPTYIVCHNCKASVTTVIKKKPGPVTYAWAIIIGKMTGLCCIPFCVDGCQDKVHYCPRCGVEAGKAEAKMCCN